MINNYSNKKYNNINTLPYLKSPSTKSFNNIEGVKGNARLSRPSYQTTEDTWVTEYSYKDLDIDVVIRQKVKIMSHNDAIRSNYYVYNEVYDRSSFNNRVFEASNSGSDFAEELVADISNKEPGSILEQIKTQMLSNPKDAINAQSRHVAERVKSLVV